MPVKKTISCIAGIKILFDMKIEFVLTGSTSEKWIREAMQQYAKRLQHYIEFRVHEINIPKRISVLPQRQQQEEEGKLLLSYLDAFDFVVLLDERGISMGSVDFSSYLQKLMNSGVRRLAFVVGGPYGFSDEVYQKGYGMISMSKMTFSHQMVRIFFTEQLYRAFTILRNEKYHHE